MLGTTPLILAATEENVLNVHPNDLLSRVSKIAPADKRVAWRYPALRRVPPSWRTCRVSMSRAYFFGIVSGWIGGLALLIAVVLTVRWS